jgi:hypothetical protein
MIEEGVQELQEFRSCRMEKNSARDRLPPELLQLLNS